MPKRKRSSPSSPVEDHLTLSRKQLHRALKTAKGFSRQKLGKRFTIAKTAGEEENVKRIEKEIGVLKGLDLNEVIERHLRKVFGKIKGFEGLGQILGKEGDVVMDEELLNARKNVESGLWNIKAVKEVMPGVVRGMYIALGIPVPAGSNNNKNKKEKDPKKSILKVVERVPISEDDGQDTAPEENRGTEDEESAWEGFDSPADDEEDSSDEGEELDDETLSKYDELIAGSSDEESFDEEEYIRNRPLAPRLSLSLSPELSEPDSESFSEPISEEHSISPQPRPPQEAKSIRVPPPKPHGSTFLPTLMGGYWSGSDSSASDIDDVHPPARKNRPGQMARRAIWEKKFGTKANHITSGQGAVAEKRKGREKDDGWDARRGAKEDGRGNNRKERRARGERRGFNGGRGAGGTGENSQPLGRKRGMGKKDDVGVLHPSWQAAKKAKEEKSKATFQGKKVTFD